MDESAKEFNAWTHQEALLRAAEIFIKAAAYGRECQDKHNGEHMRLHDALEAEGADMSLEEKELSDLALVVYTADEAFHALEFAKRRSKNLLIAEKRIAAQVRAQQEQEAVPA